MLYIKREAKEFFDEDKQEFVQTKPLNLVLEHSLIAISKWEEKWHKAFLDDNEKSEEEMVDYVRCMDVNKNTDPEVFKSLPDDVIKEVYDYINNPMSATTFQDNRPAGAKQAKQKKEIVTSELIYYWMIAYQIPPDYQKWHLNRLMNLIKICGIKAEEQDPKSKNKMSRKEILARNAELNAARRKSLHTKG